MSIEFRDVHKAFGAQQVLRGLTLAIRRAEVMFIIGTSGVGKSVAIKHLCGLLQPDSGQIFVDGKRVDHLRERDYYPLRRKVGMVFQHATLFDSMTLGQNVALPLRKHRGLSQRAAGDLACQKLRVVGMEAFSERYPGELGDGMRKRAAIARTLAMDPEYILFDEPTTGLDPVSARRVDALIGELRSLGVTSVVVSHDLTSILAVADRIAFIYQGRVRLLGSPGDYRRSRDPVVRQFMAGESEGPMETPGF